MLVPFQRKYLPFSEGDTVSELQQWFTTEAGSNILQAVTAAVERTLPDLFGYHLALYGDYVDDDLVNSSRISHRITVYSRVAGKQANGLVCDYANLPIEENTIDVMVLPHTLDFSADPHRLLREAERVLIGEGHIVIISFNSCYSYFFPLQQQ